MKAKNEIGFFKTQEDIEKAYEELASFCGFTIRLKGYSVPYHKIGFIDRSDWKPASLNAPTWQRLVILENIIKKEKLASFCEIMKALGLMSEWEKSNQEIWAVPKLLLLSNEEITYYSWLSILE